jgi:hypothetical protein
VDKRSHKLWRCGWRFLCVRKFYLNTALTTCAVRSTNETCRD